MIAHWDTPDNHLTYEIGLNAHLKTQHSQASRARLLQSRYGKFQLHFTETTIQSDCSHPSTSLQLNGTWQKSQSILKLANFAPMPHLYTVKYLRGKKQREEAVLICKTAKWSTLVQSQRFSIYGRYIVFQENVKYYSSCNNSREI